VCFLLLSLFLALWRASVIVETFLPAELAEKLLGVALTAPIPLLLLATALIAWGAIAMPWLAWILLVGGLGIVLLLLALVLRAVHRALPPAAVLLGGVLRLVGIAALVILVGFVAIAAIGYFTLAVAAVAVVFVAAFAGLAAWALVWSAANVVVYAVRLVARLTDAIAVLLQRVIDALMFPGKIVWNWFASFDGVRALHVQPIRSPEPRPLRVASDGIEAEEAAR
jgi:hypothetical protein